MNSRKRPHDEGGVGGTFITPLGSTHMDYNMFISTCMCMYMYIPNSQFVCVGLMLCVLAADDGPQMKKLSIEDPQAVAQAAIAKFVEKYVCMCVRLGVGVLLSGLIHWCFFLLLKSRSSAGTAADDHH